MVNSDWIYFVLLRLPILSRLNSTCLQCNTAVIPFFLLVFRTKLRTHLKRAVQFFSSLSFLKYYFGPMKLIRFKLCTQHCRSWYAHNFTPRCFGCTGRGEHWVWQERRGRGLSAVLGGSCMLELKRIFKAKCKIFVLECFTVRRVRSPSWLKEDHRVFLWQQVRVVSVSS